MNVIFIAPLIDGGWSSWGAWSCCGATSRSRSRACTSPSPLNGGAQCTGGAIEADSCTPLPPNCCSPDNCGGKRLKMKLYTFMKI